MPLDQFGYWVPPATVDPSELHTPHTEKYIYLNSIPNATTQTPEELLNQHYSDRANLRDWTDPNGVLRRQQETHRDFPQYAVLPIGSSGLIGRWPRPGGLRVVPVEVYGMGRVPRAREVIIEFRSRRRGDPSTGVPLRDILGGHLESLEGASDIVLDKVRAKELNLLITWLGYPLQGSLIRNRRETDDGPLTRFELAKQVATSYADFFKRVEDTCLLPVQVGFFNIALHQGENSRADSLGIQLHQLRLLKFRKGTDGFWVTDVEIV